MEDHENSLKVRGVDLDLNLDCRRHNPGQDVDQESLFAVTGVSEACSTAGKDCKSRMWAWVWVRQYPGPQMQPANQPMAGMFMIARGKMKVKQQSIMQMMGCAACSDAQKTGSLVHGPALQGLPKPAHASSLQSNAAASIALL